MEIKSLDEPLSEEASSVMELAGITLCCAQMLEREVKNVLDAAQRLGLIRLDRVRDLKIHPDDKAFHGASLGPMIRIIHQHRARLELCPDDIGALQHGNRARRDFVHHFFRTFSTDTGEELDAADAKLRSLHEHISDATFVAGRLRHRLETLLGYDLPEDDETEADIEQFESFDADDYYNSTTGNWDDYG